MTRKPRAHAKPSKAKPRDLPAGPKATNIKAGVRLKPCFITSYSTSGDA